jgi:hypothetical protein
LDETSDEDSSSLNSDIDSEDNEFDPDYFMNPPPDIILYNKISNKDNSQDSINESMIEISWEWNMGKNRIIIPIRSNIFIELSSDIKSINLENFIPPILRSESDDEDIDIKILLDYDIEIKLRVKL